MKRTSLEHVKRLIKKLSPDERRKLIPYLAEFPDTGLQSYDLSDEVEALKKHGQRLTSKSDDPDAYLFDLVFLRDLTAVEIHGVQVLRTVFLHDNFVKAFPKIQAQTSVHSENFQKLFTEEKRNAERAARKAQGIEETDAEYEADVKKRCDSTAEYWVTEKAKRIAEQISLHLPGMVGDMMAAAIKGQTFYDLYQAFRELSPNKQPPLVKDFKKIIQDSAWREVKPHLPRHTRTKPAWRGQDTLKQYAQRVNDRKALATSIKEMYEDCDYAPGWMEDLKQDATFQRLSSDVPEDVVNWATKRVASDDVAAREREPLSIACEMARRELELPEQDIETLRNYYTEGNRLLKADRTHRSQ